MKLISLLGSGAVHLPWPTIMDGGAVSGSRLDESDICRRKCSEARLCIGDDVPGEHVCEHGLTYFVCNVADERITVYGVRGPNNKTKFNQYLKDGLKGRSVSQTDLDFWLNSLRRLRAQIEEDFLQRQAELLDPLHDPIRLVKQIGTIAERLVRQQSNGVGGLDQLLEHVSPELKSLIKSSDLLTDSFDLLSIYFNPDAATYGKRHPVNVHGLLKKLVSIFRIENNDGSGSVRIYLEGECYRNAFVYDSFKLVPFALLSNAVKYNVKGSIDVSILDHGHGVEVSVCTVGPLIEPSEVETIFKKRSRGKWAKELKDGRGVGLYLAAIIAKAHDFRIDVSSKSIGEKKGKVPLATNKFSFVLPYQNLV